MKIPMKMKNQKLDAASIWKNKFGTWYMKLTYAYEDEKGLHKVIFPKVDFPFETCSVPIPYDSNCPGYVGVGILYTPIMCIKTIENARLAKGTDRLAEAKGVTTPEYAFDIITDPAVHEMSLDEIEEKLGYKIKIVNKEKNNA